MSDAPMINISGGHNAEIAKALVILLEECRNHADDVALAALDAFQISSRVENVTVKDLVMTKNEALSAEMLKPIIKMIMEELDEEEDEST